MSKTIIFKKEFEDKLKKLRIKTRFVKNFRNPKWDIPINEDKYKKLFNSAKDWNSFIGYAFQWHNTPERFQYWCEIAWK